MTSPKNNAVVLAGITLAATLLVAGCGGPDNETTMATSTDGKVEKVEASTGKAGPMTSEDAYKAQSGNNPYETKGYPKKR